MSATELAEQVERLAEGLQAGPGTPAAHALAEDAHRLVERVKQLQQIEGGDQERRQLRRCEPHRRRTCWLPSSDLARCLCIDRALVPLDCRAVEQCDESLVAFGHQLQDSVHHLYAQPSPASRGSQLAALATGYNRKPAGR